jgi:hypothetical protein
MITYKDKTFCNNPKCTCPPDRQVTAKVRLAAKSLGLPLSLGNLCQKRNDQDSGSGSGSSS